MSSLLKLISHTIGDLITLIIPKRNYRSMYAFAFLVHPRDERDMDKRFPFLKKTPKWLKRFIQHHFWPITVSEITGLLSNDTQTEIKGFVITIPMTASEMLQNKERARHQIIRATKLARNKGSKIVGLGALTSSLSRGGLDLIDIPGISITTGHAYTGYTVTQTLLTQLRSAGISLTEKKCQIAIVGAAGSIGSISAEILAQSGVRSFYLLDIQRKMSSVEELKVKLLQSYPDIEVYCGSDMMMLKNAIGIVTATNTPDALVKDIHVSPGTVIVDDAQPSDISPELYDVKDVLVLEAGAVYTPGISTNFNMGLANRNDNFCCLAEVLILASNNHTHNFVINRATLNDVTHIQEGGRRLGFTLAVPQNEHGIISKEKLEHVLSLVKKR